MYGENGCQFEPNPMEEVGPAAEDGFSQSVPNINSHLPPPLPSSFKLPGDTSSNSINTHNTFALDQEFLRLSIEDLPYHHEHHHHHPPHEDLPAVELQQQLAFDVDKPYKAERQRREQLNNNYKALRSLIPTKKYDRASIVEDAIKYIRELLRQVSDLKLLVERSRSGRDLRTEEDQGAGDVESSDVKPFADPVEQYYNNALRSTRLQRKSKDTEVDIRIIDDEVTIKLAQRKKINLLLFASKVLDELQVDLHHVAGGHVGDYYSFLFNSKIYEGCSLYASAIANKLIEVLDSASASSVLYDPLFQSLPNGYTNSSLFSCGVDEIIDGSGEGVYRDGDERQFKNGGVLEFTTRNGEERGGKVTKPYKTEMQRREEYNNKYKALRSLIPTKKDDRASIVGDAIEYITELLSTVSELKLFVERRRCRRDQRNAKQEIVEDQGAGGVESSDVKPFADPAVQFYNNALRSTWLQRKSKDTEVDVRIIDDEVAIKLAQRKKINLLLFASKVLDELQLDLHHVIGGHVGDYYSFLFNSKIYEGSSPHASAIANKLIEVLDSQYAAVPPTNSY